MPNPLHLVVRPALSRRHIGRRRHHPARDPLLLGQSVLYATVLQVLNQLGLTPFHPLGVGARSVAAGDAGDPVGRVVGPVVVGEVRRALLVIQSREAVERVVGVRARGDLVPGARRLDLAGNGRELAERVVGEIDPLVGDRRPAIAGLIEARQAAQIVVRVAVEKVIRPAARSREARPLAIGVVGGSKDHGGQSRGALLSQACDDGTDLILRSYR